MYDDEYEDEDGLIDELGEEEQDVLTEQFKKFGKEDRDTQEQFAQQSLGAKDAKRAELAKLEQELSQLMSEQSQIMRKIKLVGLDIRHEEYLQTRRRIVEERELLDATKKMHAIDQSGEDADLLIGVVNPSPENNEQQSVSENERNLEKSEIEFQVHTNRLATLKKLITEKQRSIAGLQYTLLRM